MRLLFVIFVAVLAMVLLTSPAQAGEMSVGAQDITLTSPCSACETTAVPALPQGEADEIQPYEDHTWGGDPDDDDISGWLDIYMCIGGYWDESCIHLLYHTIWLD